MVVVGAAVALLLSSRGDQGRQIATARLIHNAAEFDPIGAEASAVATLVDDDGMLRVQIDNPNLPTVAESDLEVWLIEPDDEGNPARPRVVGDF